ncbi:MAG: AMP-binding protein [Sedimentitalea sp.]
MAKDVIPLNRLSHVRGATGRALLNATIPDFLNEVVRRHGTREAAVFCDTGVRYSYDELAEQVDRVAAGLLSLGLYKGERIGIWSPNRAEWLIAQFATARIGLVLVNINPAYRGAELRHALTTVRAKALILAASFKSSDYLATLQTLAPELANCKPGHLRAKALPDLSCVIQLGPDPVQGAVAFDDLKDIGQGHRARLNAISASLSPHDAINIQFTSGTTGAPKGATLTHHNILNNAISCARAMDLGPADRVCIPVPLYHCFGMVLGNLAAASYGATMVFPSEGFDAGETLSALSDERCSAMHGVPTMFSAVLDHPDFARHDLRTLRTGIMAGSVCPEPLMRRVIKDMNCHEITIAYGMTETSPISFQTGLNDPIGARVATVGRIQPHVEVKITGKDGQTLPVGQPGQVLTRGYLVMKGYWGDPERTAQTIRNGWMHTGDMGVLDADGFLRITGRLKDMLIRGGENIYPAEIEAFLLSHPDIAEAQVFGVPDAKMGEDVAAWIIPRSSTLTVAAVQAYARENIAHYKVPRHIKLVHDMPLTATGKAQKYVMRDQMMAELGLT